MYVYIFTLELHNIW